MVLGILSAVLLVMLLLKFLTRKLGWTKLDRAMKIIHKPIGILIPIAAVFHLFFTYPVWDTREAAVVVTGIALSVMLLMMLVGYLSRRKLGKVWIKMHRYGAVIALALLLCHIVTYNIDFMNYQKSISTIRLQGMDASKLRDGSYEGEYDAGYIYAKVRVAVEDGKITDITILKHENERGKPAEAILQEIIARQTTDVDAVSGATNSSKVLKKAVEQALYNKK